MSNDVFTFEPASRKKMKARIAIAGASGSGKTFTALSLANGLAPDGQIAVIDSMHGQSRLYSDKFSFRVLELDIHSPAIYAQAIQAADSQGFDCIIIDSISSAWNGSGGALALKDQAAKKFSGNDFAAWSEITPLQNEMTEALLACKSHVICTLQSKTEYVLEKDANGKTKPKAVGMGSIQRDGFSYVLDIEIYMDAAHTGEITKTRYSDLDGHIVEKPDATLGAYILERLNAGEEAGEEHWSQSFKKRQFLLNQLDKSDIPHDALFACYGANGWTDMKVVPLPDSGSKGIIDKVGEWYASNP